MNKKNIVFAILLVIFALGGVFIGRQNKVVDVYENDETNIKNSKNMLSMMLETNVESGIYEMTTRESWPTDGYVFNSMLSKCENGSELSWDDENNIVVMSGNVSDKCYVYFDKVLTLANYIKEQYNGVQGNNNIYYHDGTLENGINDGSYRYAGASSDVNNYVCFGSNASPCPDDNLYRIIGVFDGKVKLIKSDYATKELLGEDGYYKGYYNKLQAADAWKYYKGSNLDNVASYNWDSSDNNNNWSESLLNTINLNTNFIKNIGDVWSNKIAISTWKVGGNTLENIGQLEAALAYQNEIVKPVPGSLSNEQIDYRAKIGLMYLSDYGFAAAPSAWSLNLGYLANDGYSAVRDYNWMYMGLEEWPITRNSHPDYHQVIVLIVDGSLSSGGGANNFAARPVFYLKSSVTYAEGDGTYEFPFRIN